MKSITVTTHRAQNYGAVLQSYALQKFQESLEIENLVLDATSEAKSPFLPVRFLGMRVFLVDTYINLCTLLRYKKIKTLIYKFNSFVNTEIKLTKKYYCAENLRQNPPTANLYISGSDQVFYNETGKDCDFIEMQRFLDFGTDPFCKRCSYAASVGQYNLTESQKQSFVKHLDRFDSISLREHQAKAYIQSFSDVKCDVHIDPIFLLSVEEWSSIAVPPKTYSSYILCIPLLGHRDMQAIVDYAKKKYNLPVISLQTIPVKRIVADQHVFDASPYEFLGYIQNASFVITTSFHATAFSVLFHKNYFTLIKPYKPQRMQNLAAILNQTERIISSVDEIVESDIDYSNVNGIIAQERFRAQKYFYQLIKQCEESQESEV